EEAAGHRLPLERPLAAGVPAVADAQLAEHPGDDAVHVGAAGGVLQERLVLGLDGLPVGPVHVRVVEEVAVDPPGLVVDLLPLGPRLDPHLDGVEVQPAGTALAAGRAGRRGLWQVAPARAATAPGRRAGGRRGDAAGARRRGDEPVAAARIEHLAAVGGQLVAAHAR